MTGFGPLGALPYGAATIDDDLSWIESGPRSASLVLTCILIPDRSVDGGTLIKSTSRIWAETAKRLGKDWSLAFQIPWSTWEEIVAGAFKRAGYDEVLLTPRSRDFGRDVVAIKKGIGCIKIIGSMKAYKLGHLVRHDDVRALLGVLNAEQDTSKGMFVTTSDFAPTIVSDKFIAPYLPTRLELMNGKALQSWLRDLLSQQNNDSSQSS